MAPTKTSWRAICLFPSYVVKLVLVLLGCLLLEEPEEYHPVSPIVRVKSRSVGCYTVYSFQFTWANDLAEYFGRVSLTVLEVSFRILVSPAPADRNYIVDSLTLWLILKGESDLLDCSFMADLGTGEQLVIHCICMNIHFLFEQHCFFLPDPPNFFLSRQLAHVPQSSLCWQPLQFPHLLRFLLPSSKRYIYLVVNPLNSK